MIARLAEQIFRNWLKLFLTYLELHALDFEDINEVELYGLKYFCIIPFEGSKEKKLISLSECRTLMMKLVIIVKTLTPNEKTCFWKSLVVFYEHVENNRSVNELEYGLEFIAEGKEHNKQPTNMALSLEISERQRRSMANSKPQQQN